MSDSAGSNQSTPKKRTATTPPSTSNRNTPSLLPRLDSMNSQVPSVSADGSPSVVQKDTTKEFAEDKADTNKTGTSTVDANEHSLSERRKASVPWLDSPTKEKSEKREVDERKPFEVVTSEGPHQLSSSGSGRDDGTPLVIKSDDSPTCADREQNGATQQSLPRVSSMGELDSAASRSISEEGQSAGGTPSPTIGAGPITQTDADTINNQLAALKKRRLQKMKEEGLLSPMAQGSTPEAKVAPLNLGKQAQLAEDDKPNSAPLDAKISVTAASPLSKNPPGKGKAPVPKAGRRANVEATAAKPKSGRRAASSDPPSKSKSSGSSINADILTTIVNKMSTSANWQSHQEGVENLRELLQKYDAVAGLGSNTSNAAAVALVQNTHGIVNGLLTVADSARSNVAKAAVDVIGLFYQKLGPANLMAVQSNKPDDQEEDEANSELANDVPPPIVGPSATDAKRLENFVESVVTKLVAKGGASNSRFLVDSAQMAMREVISGVSATRAVHAILATSLPKLEKSRLLYGNGLLQGFEGVQPKAFGGKDTLSRIVKVVDSFVNDASPDVRELGKRLAAQLAQHCSESGERIAQLVQKTLGPSQQARSEKVLSHCKTGGSSTPREPGTPVQPPSETPQKQKTPATQAPNTARSSAPPSATSSTHATPAPKPKPSSAVTPRMSSTPSSNDASLNFGPPPAATARPSQHSVPTLDLMNGSNSVPVSPARSTLGADGPLPASAVLASPRFQPHGSNPLMSPTASGLGTPSSLSTNTSFALGSTVARDLQSEHGAYSQSIFLCAEGNGQEKLQALNNIKTLLDKHLMTSASANAGAVHEAPMEQRTEIALCDVIALRCADMNSKIQCTALELVPLLMKAIDPAVVDSTSPRWISCVTMPLSSSYAMVHSTASAALRAILARSSDDNLRTMSTTLTMTLSTVRNLNAKVAMLVALRDIVVRHGALSLANNPLGATAGSQPRPTSSSSINGNTPSFLATTNTSVGLSRSDLRYIVDSCIRTYGTDPREEVKTHNIALMTALFEHGYRFQEAPFLDGHHISTSEWVEIKQQLDACLQQASSK